MDHLFKQALAASVEVALKRLLCEKHLYQQVEVDLACLVEVSKEISADIRKAGPTFGGPGPNLPPATQKQILESGIAGTNAPWCFAGSHIGGAFHDLVMFEIPSINTYCDQCKHRPPFNPIADMCWSIVRPELPTTQWYHLAYACQQCGKAAIPVHFIVRREGLKLRLTGRDPIEAVPSPKVLPEPQNKYFSSAQIAHNAGQTLAGIFLLRVFIEQFWRSVPEIQKLIQLQPRATGDEQGDAYQSTLPDAFKERFPSLKEVYGKLSGAMHAADANAELFDDSCKKIERHFDARRLFELK